MSVVLMVEDNPGDARLIREMFKERGSSATEVVHVERMKEAEDYLATHAVDMILLDLGLPDAQGLQAVRRATAAAPRSALVVLSGLEDEGVALQAMQQGAQDYLVKGQLETMSILRALRFAMERKLLEEALYIEKERAQVTLDWMQRAKVELERSNRELQEFASVASHDLQEPLRKIRAFGDRLAQRTEGALDDDSRADLERIQGAAARMQALIDDLLEYALVTTRARPFRAVDLEVVAAEVLGDLAARIEDSAGRVEVGPLPIIEADPTQMRQLLQNLLGNGLKFQREGVPPLIRLSAGPVAGIVGRGESVALTISDNGIGFEARHAERIFAPFERLHGRTAYEGTGVGLAICHKIVERHAGDITASGRPGEGATFTVILPLRQATPAALALPTSDISLGLPMAVSV